MKRRLQPVILYVTFNKAVTQREAAKALDFKLRSFDISGNPIYVVGDLYVDKIRTREFDRTLAARKRVGK